jgi:predicted transcriptional regulator
MMLERLMPDITLNDADDAIVDVLHEGRNVPKNIADETGYTRQYVSTRLKRLREHGIVINIGQGVYELVPEEIPDE